MHPFRAEQVRVGGVSSVALRLKKAVDMKKDCASTRKSLRKYLRGHLFKYEQVRIARHLNACPLCRSEFQALQKVADTKQLLRDITPPEGVSQRMKAGAAGLAKLKVLIYRPLWMFLLVGRPYAALCQSFCSAPGRRDREHRKVPAACRSRSPRPRSTPGSQRPLSAPVQVSCSSGRPSPPPAPEPLRRSPSFPAMKRSLARINEIMRGHGELRKMKFSESVREVAGSLTEKELGTFFDRMEQDGKVSYSRKKHSSLSRRRSRSPS